MNTLPFNEPFRQAWEEWLAYRKERHLPCYKPIGLKRTFTMLIELSNNDEQTAIKMIHRALANNWQGFNFKLPDNGFTTNQTSNRPLGTSEKRIAALKTWGSGV